MKNTLRLLSLSLFAALPFTASASLLDNVPVEAISEPPCEAGAAFIADASYEKGGACVPRRFAREISGTSARAKERAELRRNARMQTHRTQKEGVRETYLHPTGVRAASGENPFDLLKPNSRQYNPSKTQVQTNLETLRTRYRELGAAGSRYDLSSIARSTTRTRQNFFWNPTNNRVRRGLRQ